MIIARDLLHQYMKVDLQTDTKTCPIWTFLSIIIVMNFTTYFQTTNIFKEQTAKIELNSRLTGQTWVGFLIQSLPQVTGLSASAVKC